MEPNGMHTARGAHWESLDIDSRRMLQIVSISLIETISWPRRGPLRLDVARRTTIRKTRFIKGTSIVKLKLLGIALAGSCALAISLNPVHAEILALDTDGQYVPGQIIVKFTPGAARSEIAEANRARPKEEMQAERTWILEVEPGEEVEIANNLAKNPNIEFAEPNYIYSVIPCATGDCEAPNDLQFGAKWDLHNTGYVTNTAGQVVAETGVKGADIAWLEAYEYLRNSGITPATAVLGVIDTGIRANHQDLAGKVLAGRNFCPSFLCLVGTVNAANWADDNGHGTHVAGIAAAHGNNTHGTPGVAFVPEAKLLAIKVCGGPLGLCNAAGISNGITWAVNNGAHVLNLSLGGGAPSVATQTALQFALANNVLPICASGNDGAEAVSYPAAFPECMAVASSNWSDERASYSNAGPEIEVAAPGGDVGNAPHSYILASYHSNDTSYAYLAGTSMATPQVAGLATLLRASGMTNMADVRARIRGTADDIAAEGFDNATGHGRINVYRALTQMDPFIEFQNSHRASVNLASNGMLQVVLAAQDGETFSLDQIQIGSILLNGVSLANRSNGTPFVSWNEAGDLVLHFSVPRLRGANALKLGENLTTLSATLDDGRRLRAFTTVNVR
jgi:thermitase